MDKLSIASFDLLIEQIKESLEQVIRIRGTYQYSVYYNTTTDGGLTIVYICYG